MNTMTTFTARYVLAIALLFAAGAPALGQTPAAPPPPPQDDPLLRVGLPPVTVSAQKEPEDIQKLPVSVTAVTKDMIERAGIRVVSDAAIFSPNTHFTEFSARKLSNARFRGIGASPTNPAITTFIDGVPQLNANSSSIDLLDVQQIEFVRGPQSALFGRNTLGGLINVVSGKPAFTKWTGAASIPFGNYSAFELRGNATGTLVPDTLAASAAFSYAARDGFTTNDLSGNDLDSRGGFTGKGQLLWKPAPKWEARVIVTGERAEDGDYALNDLEALRANPHRSSRDFEGFTNRNVFATTVQTERRGDRFTVSTTTGLVRWTTDDSTDLDYSALPLVTRRNEEKDFQFTQEARVASAAPVKMERLGPNTTIRWQSGVFLFTQNYQQDAVNSIAPFVFSPLVTVPVKQYSPVAALDDFGLGVFGQGTMTVNDRIDVIAGARIDYEKKNADLKTFFDPAIDQPTVLNADESFSSFSPQVSVAYRLQPDRNVYATVSRGFKAGGFNPASPAGSEVYDEELSWNLEGGYKSRWANGKVALNAALFFIDWNDLQLNVPNIAVAGQIFIANVGGASSKGFEVDVTARPLPGVDVFGALGYTNATFDDDTTSLGQNVSGNKIPNTPDYTASFGVQYARAVRQDITAYGRADVALYGAFKYDDMNTQEQDAYALTNLRAGVRRKMFFAEGWIKNAFDTNYIPVAFAYGPLAPSGFVGESGAPRTFGLSVGITF
jgi:iron complex outermembrane receptor protein